MQGARSRRFDGAVDQHVSQEFDVSDPNQTPPDNPRQLYEGFGYRARKQLGQHFLIDAGILHEIATLADIRQGDRVLEIGAGCGTLTLVLLQRGAEVDAVELDDNAVEYLEERLVPHFPLELYGESALDVDYGEIFDSTPVSWKVVANLPYQVAAKILFRLFEYTERIEEMTLMFQKEVAQCIVAEPGDSDYGRLSLMSKLYSDVHLPMILPQDSFVPPPKVESAIVQFRPVPGSRIDDDALRDAFARIVKAAFQARRKTLANGLKALGCDKSLVEETLEALDLKQKIRPQRVGFEDFVALAQVLLDRGELD